MASLPDTVKATEYPSKFEVASPTAEINGDQVNPEYSYRTTDPVRLLVK
jgi:hypothetical protein